MGRTVLRLAAVAAVAAVALAASMPLHHHRWVNASKDTLHTLLARMEPGPAVDAAVVPTEGERPQRWPALASRDLAREFECLALNVYWEARSEPELGRAAVAAVTLNRLAHPDFPDTICGVVYQGAVAGRRDCQFSWVCDRRPDRPQHQAAWHDARNIAYQALFLDKPDPTQGSLYFHATYVRPAWARQMVKVTRIGKHIYYRERMTAENDRRPASRS